MSFKSIKNPLSAILKWVMAPLQNLLSKLKVFHQILLVILIMVSFLALEGYLGLTMIAQVQNMTQKLFQTSVASFQNILAANQEVDQIRQQFTDTMLTQQPLTVFALDNIMTATNYSEYQDDARSIKDGIEELQGFSGQIPSAENYQEFNHCLLQISRSLNSIQGNLTSTTLQTMNNGNKFFQDSQFISILILAISLIVSIAVGLIIAAMISGPLKEMAVKVNALATGDLTQTLNSKGCREINQVVTGFNHAVISLRKLVGDIDEHARMLALAGSELRDAAANSGRAAGEVAQVIEELTKASTDQAKQVEQTANTINELGVIVRTVSSDAARMASMSQRIAASASVGQKVTADVASEMNNLYETTQNINAVINEMNQASAEISEIASMIGNVSEQTSLLALNAAIEAARAGEHGKGFSVVATETGKLAEQSKQASQKISHLTVQMIGRSENATEVIKHGIERAQESKSLTTEAAVTFESIFKELGEVLSEISKVAELAQGMAERNEAMIGAVTHVAAISEEGLASTEEVAASVEEQNAGAEQVASLAENLASLAEQLKAATAAFKV